jgi:hypothetical protein
MINVQSGPISQRHIRLKNRPLTFSPHTPNNYFLIYPSLLSIQTLKNETSTKDEAQGA